MQGVLVEFGIIYPIGVTAILTRQWPIDGSLAAALGVALEMVVKEPVKILKITLQVASNSGS